MQEVCYVNCVRNELERHHVRFSPRLVRLMVLLSAQFLEIWDGGTQDRARETLFDATQRKSLQESREQAANGRKMF
ncbi:hypothetical protein VNO77_50196 [Canavalia gladiata]|uniref:Uncharacterized protein n=1 Tax=Canavalia gladiata TaxID=3824 RepID=A0AAN9JFQ6_CANGL